MASNNEYKPRNGVEKAILRDLRRARLILEQLNHRHAEDGQPGTDPLDEGLPHWWIDGHRTPDSHESFRRHLVDELEDLKMKAIVGLPPERKEVKCPRCGEEFKP